MCPNCKSPSGGHFFPPSMGEAGFFICGQTELPSLSKTTAQLSKWDQRFMDLAKLVASWSKDPSTQTGAVLVSPCRTDVILGYNGFPRRMRDLPERYSNREDKYSRIVHCEMNAVLNAKRGVSGYTLYTWPFLSCDRCATHMVAAGIARAVGPKPPADQASRWQAALDKTKGYFAEAGVEIVEYDSISGEYEPYVGK